MKRLMQTNQARITQAYLFLPVLFTAILLSWAGALPTSAQESREQARLQQAEEEFSDLIENQLVDTFLFVQSASGVLISREGHFLTNYHVIHGHLQSEGTRMMEVETTGGESHQAWIVGIDPRGDLALGKIVDTDRRFPHLDLASSDDLSVGQFGIAIGNPFMRGLYSAQPSVSFGLISDRHVYKQTYPDAVQTDAPINPGNSGGPLITLNGKLAGINGRIETRFGTRANSGVGYAISSSQIKRFLPTLKKGGITFHARINALSDPLVVIQQGDEIVQGNIESSTLSRVEEGVRIDSLNADSNTYRAGLREGDIVTSVAGYPVQNRARLRGIIESHTGGSSLSVTYLREGEESSAEIETGQFNTWEDTLELLPDSGDWGQLGVSLETSDRGVLIGEVIEGTPASRAGLQAGDLILEINERPAMNPEVAIRLIQSRWIGESVDLKIERDGETGIISPIIAETSEE